MQSVKWGEYKLGDLFEVCTYKKRFDANKVELLENEGYPYIVRMSSDNGQKGLIKEDTAFLNDGNTLSFGQDTATVFYQKNPYFTGDKIKILKCKDIRFSSRNALFFVTAVSQAFSQFSWGTSSYSIETIESQKIQIPIKDGQIDFEFMEDFVAELEARRVAELEAYLSVTGLKDYTLTDEEVKALENYTAQPFEEFSVTDIFDIKNTSNILSIDIVENSGEIPYLCASAGNNAVSSYISYDEKYLEKGNCIFIGGKTFVVSYQKDDFYSNDSHNLALYCKELANTKLNQLFLATCVYKSLCHKYSWGDSVSKTKIKNDNVSLPTKAGNPDYSSMSTIISAIQKLVIKDVVLYTDRKIEATKKIRILQ